MKAPKMVIGLLIALASLQANAAEYIVKYRNHHSLKSLNLQFATFKSQHTKGSFVTLDLNEQNKVKALLNLYSDPNVEYIVPNAKMRAFTAPLDVNALKDQWHIKKVRAQEAWNLAGNKGTKKITVAVIDTGIDYNHPSLKPNMVAGYDFAKDDSDPMDQTSAQNPGHGTHCAGLIGATGLVEGGTIGLSPEVSLMPIRFLDERGSGDLDNSIKSIDFAIEKGAKVISASWGAAINREEARPMLEAIERAAKAGIVFVVAASNDGKNNDSYEVYPANAKGVNTISVAASDINDAKPYWSNYGKGSVDLASPGAAIMSTVPNGKYQNMDGTSMATPVAAGLVALILAQDPNLTPSQVRSLIQSSATKVAIETACDCRIDALGAMETVKNKKMFVSPYAATVAKGEKLQFEAVYGKAPFTFTSANPEVASISEDGQLEALVEQGETTVSVTDANGNTATSYKIYVGKQKSDNGGGGGGGGGDGECPLGDPQLCEIMCQIVPDMPWCK